MVVLLVSANWVNAVAGISAVVVALVVLVVVAEDVSSNPVFTSEVAPLKDVGPTQGLDHKSHQLLVW